MPACPAERGHHDPHPLILRPRLAAGADLMLIGSRSALLQSVAPHSGTALSLVTNRGMLGAN